VYVNLGASYPTRCKHPGHEVRHETRIIRESVKSQPHSNLKKREGKLYVRKQWNRPSTHYKSRERIEKEMKLS
jgi:hypothetical protein